MNPRLLFLVPLLPLLLSACGTTGTVENTGDYDQTIRKLQERLVLNPGDAEALRDLGVIYFETHQYPQARDYLKKASIANDHDGKTLFYLGMTREYDNDLKGALGAYINYTDIASGSPYRKLMEARYHDVTKALIAEQFRSLAASEDSLGRQATPSNALAVFPLVYDGKDQKYSPLGLGLAEMMTVDFGKVKKLKLVERLRVDELLSELKFSASSAIDPATAPRLGKFLSAGQIVGGMYNVSPDNNLRLDVASLDIGKGKTPSEHSESDELANLFRIQKQVVFDVVKSMGITLTREEQDDIQRVPTKNLQAFISYSIGLEKEGQGDFESASVYYKQATTLDPSFSAAKAKGELSDAMVLSGPSKETALSASHKISPPPLADDKGGKGGKHSLIASRFGHLGQMIRLGFIPGVDSRKPTADAFNAGALLGELPAPPPPPPVR
ncbi:MAG TPA: tetratricopeptide repeat protein [Bacteroidota bacterium]|nr:tetratricopeptide repeat protein [Bacteroidota bacterium]